MRRSLLIFYLVLGLVLAGCFGAVSTRLEDPNQYQEMNLSEAEMAPAPEEIEYGATRVLIQEIDLGGDDLAAEQNLDRIVESSIADWFETVGVERIDREAAQELAEEIRLVQDRDAGRYAGPDVADYAVRGRIIRADASTEIVREGFAQAHCKYDATVEFELDIYSLPEMERVTTVNLSASGDEALSSDYWSRCDVTARGGSRVFGDITDIAVDLGRVDLQNAFAPRGYVVEGRQMDDDYIFMVNIGDRQNIQEGWKVEFMRTSEYEDRLSGQTFLETNTIGEGFITNQFGPTYSWVRVPDEDVAQQLEFGNEARVVFERRFDEDLLDFIH